MAEPGGDGTRTALPTILFWSAVVAVVAVRLNQCTHLTANTADVVRHLLYGLVATEWGPYQLEHSLSTLSDRWPPVPWIDLPYNYPPVALGFFAGISQVSATVFFAKVALTAVEGVNAWLVGRITGQRWLALLYWACPVSIWWVSREAQFEPLQNLFALAALAAVRRHPALACAALGLAIQTKLTAAALAPAVAWVVWTESRRAAPAAAAAFAASFLPTALLATQYPVVAQVLGMSSPLPYNPYFWNLAERSMFGWNPTWLIVLNQLASWGVVAATGILAWRSRERLAYLAPLVWLAFLKLHTNVGFWYVLVFPTMVLGIRDRRARTALLLAWPLLDVRATIQLIAGPFGYIGPDLGMPSALDPYSLPPLLF